MRLLFFLFPSSPQPPFPSPFQISAPADTEIRSIKVSKSNGMGQVHTMHVECEIGHSGAELHRDGGGRGEVGRI